AGETSGLSKGKDETSEFLEKFSADLSVKSGEHLWIHNRHGRIRLEGEIGIREKLSEPVFTGRLFTREGYVMYLDRKFNITEGYVELGGRVEKIPYIEIGARTRLRSLRQEEDTPYDIDLMARGPVNDIQVDLTSRPPLDVSDIVSLLTFGALRSQLTESERVLSLRAEELASRRVNSYISAYAGNVLNLDTMLIEGNIFRTGSREGLRVRARKGITENVALAYVGDLSDDDSSIVTSRTTGKTEIIYTEGLGRTEEQELKLKYSFTPSLSAEAITDQTGRSNIGLKYSIWIR
ncbi:MAG: translocation/assembly module TamB domain-containing protein, partial [Elusimicrobiota bacterium]